MPMQQRKSDAVHRNGSPVKKAGKKADANLRASQSAKKASRGSPDSSFAGKPGQLQGKAAAGAMNMDSAANGSKRSASRKRSGQSRGRSSNRGYTAPRQ